MDQTHIYLFFLPNPKTIPFMIFNNLISEPT